MDTTLSGKEKYRTYTDDIDWSNVNLNDAERWISALGGGALVAYGLSRRSWGGLALAALGAAFVYRGTTGHCAVYAGLGTSTNHIGRRKVQTDRAIKVEKSITIDRPAADLYKFWRQFDNLPRFMKHIESIEVKDNRHSHWTVKAPLGLKVEWDAEVITEVPNELIGWRALENSDVDNAGSVRFESSKDGRRTIVRVALQYDPPGGTLGAAFAKIFGEDPDRLVQQSLWELKQMMESRSDVRADTSKATQPTG